jgi:4-hydroxy-2-oxoheptanedioate aldolase
MDLCQDLGHAGDPAHPDVQKAVADAAARIRAAGKCVREDFMNFGWINDLLTIGAQHAFAALDQLAGSRMATNAAAPSLVSSRA